MASNQNEVRGAKVGSGTVGLVFGVCVHVCRTDLWLTLCCFGKTTWTERWKAWNLAQFASALCTSSLTLCLRFHAVHAATNSTAPVCTNGSKRRASRSVCCVSSLSSQRFREPQQPFCFK